MGWLFGIARHVLARSLERGRVDDDVRRRLAMEPLVLNDDVLASIEDVETGPALTALDELPRSQRDAVRSRVIDDREYGEVASDSVARRASYASASAADYAQFKRS